MTTAEATDLAAHIRHQITQIRRNHATVDCSHRGIAVLEMLEELRSPITNFGVTPNQFNLMITQSIAAEMIFRTILLYSLNQDDPRQDENKAILRDCSLKFATWSARITSN